MALGVSHFGFLNHDDTTQVKPQQKELKVIFN